MPTDRQLTFLESEFWLLSWGASVQHSSLYTEGISTETRGKFRAQVISHCRAKVIPAYTSTVTERTHLNNLEQLVETISAMAAPIFRDRYRVGIAQKLINLQLKYLWCSGAIPMPPHCPVDAIVLGKTRLSGKLNWTQMDCLDEYKDAINAIREVAGDQSLAEWELVNFRRRFESQ